MPQRMNVYHFKKGTEICNYSYPNNILAVKLNRQVSSPGFTATTPEYYTVSLQAQHILEM